MEIVRTKAWRTRRTRSGRLASLLRSLTTTSSRSLWRQEELVKVGLFNNSCTSVIINYCLSALSVESAVANDLCKPGAIIL